MENYKQKQKPFPVNKRNLLLKEFFQKIFGTERVEIVGNKNKPKVVIIRLGEKLLINGFVSNYTFNLTTEQYGGEITKSVSFHKSVLDSITDLELSELYSEIYSKHTQDVLTLVLEVDNNSGRKLNYAFDDSNGNPIFSLTESRYFFTIKSALEKYSELKEKHNIETLIQ